MKDLIKDGTWNAQLITQLFSKEIADHIIDRIFPPINSSGADRPIWILEAKGNFTVRSAW